MSVYESCNLVKGCLKGDVALVTGATSNVGRGYAKALAWAGAKVAVVGRSLVIGKPVSMLLNDRDATVTLCHSRTPKLAEVTKAADIVVLATGRAKAYGPEYFSAHQTVIDVGINTDPSTGKMCGDVDFGTVAPKVAAITPVPGGLGAVTTAVLVSHVVEACKKAVERK